MCMYRELHQALQCKSAVKVKQTVYWTQLDVNGEGVDLNNEEVFFISRNILPISLAMFPCLKMTPDS